MNYKQSLKVDTQIFVVGPQIANPQIFGLILQTQNHKFLRCDSPQNRKSANLWKLLVGSRMQRSESNQLSRPRDIRRIFWGFCINRLGIGPIHYVSSRSDLASNSWRYSYRKSANVFVVPVRKSQFRKEKSSVFDPLQIKFAFNISLPMSVYFRLRNFL
jgi:hypothetical protein